jgi:hypothetical protein
MRGPSYFSLAWADEMPGRQENGPLFQRVREYLSTDGITEEDFESRWAEEAVREVSYFEGDALQSIPFDFEFVSELNRSCLGPISFDESGDWVAFSYICPANDESAFARYLTFERSPELTVTAYFEGNLLRKVEAHEPLVYPGRSLIRMDAYERLKARLDG